MLMPEIGSARVQEIPTYTGARDSNRIVYNVRSKIELLHPPQYSTDQCEQLPIIIIILTSYTCTVSKLLKVQCSLFVVYVQASLWHHNY